MAGKEENNRVIISETSHKPFSVSGPDSYFISFEDLVPGKLGDHINDNMMGLWIPPFRLLSSISVKRNGILMKPIGMTISDSGRVFDFSDFDLGLSYSRQDGCFKLDVISTHMARPVDLILQTDVIPIWGIEAGYGFSTHERNGRVDWEIDPIGEEVELSASGEYELAVEGSVVKIRVLRDATCWIRRKSRPLPEQSVSEWSALVQEVGTDLNSPGSDLGYYFNWAKSNMKWLYFHYDGERKCIAAGQPEFPWFFSVDTFIALEGILSAGFFGIARNSLDTLFSLAQSRNGVMPHEILATGKISNPGNLEETAYMPIALRQYHAWTGDDSLIRRHLRTALKGMNILAGTDLKGKGVMEDHNAGEGIDIDTASYFVRALEALEYLSHETCMEIDGENLQSINGLHGRWKKFVLEEMWVKEHSAFADRYIDGVPVMKGFWTTIIPFEQGLPDRSKFEQFVKGDHLGKMVTHDGLRVDDNGFVMPVNTGLLVKAALKYGYPEMAVENLRKNLGTFGKFSSASFPEITNNSKGCFLQAWSAALAIENVVCGFLGIKPTPEGPEVNPVWSDYIAPPGSLLSNLRVRDKTYSITLEGAGKYKID